MQTISLLMVGTGGFAGFYLHELLTSPRASRFEIVGAVDPYAEKNEYGIQLRDKGVPIYNTVEEFYAEHNAQMALIVTPIHLHAHQAEYCMEHGSDVLCEKPICASLADAEEMIAVRNRTGRKLAIGFQWSYSASILQLKQDILDGVYGKIRRFRTIVYFPRNLDYYHRGSGWAGRRCMPTGEPLLDSVASNATAHYLHNMLFLTGAQIDRSAEPAQITAEIYRANPIEMFDTCAMRVMTQNDVELMFFTTHAVPNDQGRNPEFVIEGEKGTVTLRQVEGKEELTALMQDGTTKTYEAPSADLHRKLYFMADAIQSNGPLPCIPETAVPHLKCICTLADMFPETPVFPAEQVQFSEQANQYTCKDLGETLDRCWKDGKLPFEEQVKWAQEPRTKKLL